MKFALHKARPIHAAFGPSASGLAAVEFALILPVMLLFIFGGFETVRAITCVRRLTFLANAIAQQVTSNTTGKVSNADMHFFYNTTMVVFPQVLNDSGRYGNYWWQDINISVSSISFVTLPLNCTAGCTYIPNVLWSGGATRSCYVPAISASDQSPPSATTLPVDVFGPGLLIVVDLRYTFHTILSGSFVGNYIPSLDNLSFKRSVYVQPRYVSTINYQSTWIGAGNDDIVSTCPTNQP